MRAFAQSRLKRTVSAALLGAMLTSAASPVLAQDGRDNFQQEEYQRQQAAAKRSQKALPYARQEKSWVEKLFTSGGEAEPVVSGAKVPGPMAESKKPAIRTKAAAFLQQHGCQLGDAVYFRAFKENERVDVWAKCQGSDRFKKITSWNFTATQNSQMLGYKNYRYDAIIPEGMRRIYQVNDSSSYYLSFNMGYPDAADNARPMPALIKNPKTEKMERPARGGDAMMHGPYGSIGCIPIAIEHIELAYAMTEAALRAKAPVFVDIFPTDDMSSAHLNALVRAKPEYKKYMSFWQNMANVDKKFRTTGVRQDNIVPQGTMYALREVPSHEVPLAPIAVAARMPEIEAASQPATAARDNIVVPEVAPETYARASRIAEAFAALHEDKAKKACENCLETRFVKTTPVILQQTFK